MNIGEKLKTERQKRNYSQTDLANKLNISRQAISKWETGREYPDIDNLIILSKLYNVSVDELIGAENIADEHSSSEEKMWSASNEILLVILVIVSCLLPVIGIIVSLWVLFRKEKRIIITILCILYFLTNVFSTAVVVNNLFFKQGTATVTQLS